ncbi:hypothetical protein KP509_02G094500 [Ceratopteris richardii]|uniref:TORTIFOLIA1/SINE1-2 N-terminal domain-containing protein n=1 Tax=Ceratopteris richardii TaxID=49495 RepID=A0A8T2VFT1_CERRI|nr:hypothetical protein KP509_02G094500 [Ceratopteris richardii]
MVKPNSSSLLAARPKNQSMPSFSPPADSRLSMQLKHDLVMLAHKDSSIRRRSMKALTTFIERKLDVGSMRNFLQQISEQISDEIGDNGGIYAVSLFIEIARVHKTAIVPFISHIMAAVLHSLASSRSGDGYAKNLHGTCAKVVGSIAKYAIEPAYNVARSSTATDILDSLCQPLLGLISSNVEPVAVGSATCLRAIVEAENWRFAAPELVHDVCTRSSSSLAEMGKHSVPHIRLANSLAKFNAGILQDSARRLLKVGTHLLGMVGESGTACDSWQQRVAAAQLLGTLIDHVHDKIIGLDLVSTTEALENCRLDKVAAVRQAVAEALSVAKRKASKNEHFLLQDCKSEVSSIDSIPTCTRLLKHGARSDRPCRTVLVPNDNVVDAEELPSISSVSSLNSIISSSSTPPIRSALPPEEDLLAIRRKNSLFPLKDSPVFPPSVDKYVAESDVSFTPKKNSTDITGVDTIEATSKCSKDGVFRVGAKDLGAALLDLGKGKRCSAHGNLGDGNQHTICLHKQTCTRVAKYPMLPDDFLTSSTRRVLMRSLPSANSMPNLKRFSETDQGSVIGSETRNESRWHIHDNPIAGDNDQGNLCRLASTNKQRCMLSKDMDVEIPTDSHTSMLSMSADAESPVISPLNERTVKSSESDECVETAQDWLKSQREHDVNFYDNCEGLHKNGCAGGPNKAPSSECYICRRTRKSCPSDQMSLPLNSAKSSNWTRFRSLVRKILFYAEVLVCILFLVLAFRIAFVYTRKQCDLHGLVPT